MKAFFKMIAQKIKLWLGIVSPSQSALVEKKEAEDLIKSVIRCIKYADDCDNDEDKKVSK